MEADTAHRNHCSVSKAHLRFDPSHTYTVCSTCVESVGCEVSGKALKWNLRYTRMNTLYSKWSAFHNPPISMKLRTFIAHVQKVWGLELWENLSIRKASCRQKTALLSMSEVFFITDQSQPNLHKKLHMNREFLVWRFRKILLWKMTNRNVHSSTSTGVFIIKWFPGHLHCL